MLTVPAQIFLRTDAGKIEGGLTLHAWRLGCVWIECMTRNHTNAVMFPFRGVFTVIVAHVLLLPLQQGLTAGRQVGEGACLRRDVSSIYGQGSAITSDVIY
jgi:hypothetical protein